MCSSVLFFGMVLHGIAWYCMILHCILLGIVCNCIVLHGIAWYLYGAARSHQLSPQGQLGTHQAANMEASPGLCFYSDRLPILLCIHFTWHMTYTIATKCYYMLSYATISCYIAPGSQSEASSGFVFFQRDCQSSSLFLYIFCMAYDTRMPQSIC